MLEGKIRVEITQEPINKESCGRVRTKQVFEETCVYDKDKRKKIAPYGVHAIFSVRHYPNFNSKDIMDIRVSRRYFELDMSGCYVASFEINSKIFHLFVNFDEEEYLNDVTLSELYDDDYDGLVDTNYTNGNGLVSYEIVEE